MLTVDFFLEIYRKLGGSNDIVVGFSGGVDSTVLLELCYRARLLLNCKIKACHINHKLHVDADLWAQHCVQLCHNYNIPLSIHTITTKLTSNIEANARNFRRAVFANLLAPGTTLLLGHNANDQAETILQRIFRGTGIVGLKGMAQSQNFAAGQLLRPLLLVTRAEIAQFATNNKLVYLEDPSNNNLRFTRNLLRTQVLPILQSKWPQVVANINRLGELAAVSIDAQQQADEQVLQDLQQEPKNIISISKLTTFTASTIAMLLRTWIKSLGYQVPTKKQLDSVMNNILTAKLNNKAQIKIGNYYLYRYRDHLYLLANSGKQLPWATELNSDATICAPNGQTLMVQIPKGLTIKLVLGSQGTKARKIFQAHGIPHWERNSYILVFDISNSPKNCLVQSAVKQQLIQIVNLWFNPAYAGRVDIHYETNNVVS